MGWTSIVVGLVLAAFILSALPKVKEKSARGALSLLALVVLFLGLAFSSVRYIPSDRVGILTKEAMGPHMSEGRIIAQEGEVGVQADILYPGWHFWYWPGVYKLDNVPMVQVGSDEVGVIEAWDGLSLPEGQVVAEERTAEDFERMLRDPKYFLTEGRGQKGPQANVLTPGSYRINTELFKVTTVRQTDVKAGTVAVLKSNVGGAATVGLDTAGTAADEVKLSKLGEKGIRVEPLGPGKYPINPKAFEVYTVSTERRVAHYTEDEDAGGDVALTTIPVKSRDGFNFPVDVRVVYFIKSGDAPRVVALLGGDNRKLQEVLDSRVRSIFRDNAENVSALDYINQRSEQARKSGAMLQAAMSPYGVTIESIDIGDVGRDNVELGMLLETQRLRKLAEEEEKMFRVQQVAAEQKKQLTKTVQEAEEEKRLATARYEVQIAEQDKERVIIAAQAEAESIEIRAKAQAEQFRVIAEQIGSGNAALIELLQVIGERGIQITPRVMVTGGDSGGADGQTTALIGTMLDSMVAREGGDG